MIKLRAKSVVALIILYIFAAIITALTPKDPNASDKSQVELVIEEAMQTNPVMIELFGEDGW